MVSNGEINFGGIPQECTPICLQAVMTGGNGQTYHGGRMSLVSDLNISPTIIGRWNSMNSRASWKSICIYRLEGEN